MTKEQQSVTQRTLSSRILPFVSILATTLALSACGSAVPSIVSAEASDSVDGGSSESVDSVVDDAAGGNSLVANQSALVEHKIAPGRTSVPMRMLESVEPMVVFGGVWGTQPGATFALVDGDGEFVLSGDPDLPVVLVTLRIGRGPDLLPHISLSLNDVLLDDKGDAQAWGCGIRSALVRAESGEYQLQPDYVTQTNGQTNGPTCANPSLVNADFFDHPVAIDIRENGFVLTTQDGDHARFEQMTPAGHTPDGSAQVPPATTIVVAPTKIGD